MGPPMGPLGRRQGGRSPKSQIFTNEPVNLLKTNDVRFWKRAEPVNMLKTRELLALTRHVVDNKWVAFD